MSPIIVERRQKVTELWKRGDMDMTTTGASTYGLQYLHLLRHTLYSSLLFDSFFFPPTFWDCRRHRQNQHTDDEGSKKYDALVLEMFPILILAIFRTSSAVFEQTMR